MGYPAKVISDIVRGPLTQAAGYFEVVRANIDRPLLWCAFGNQGDLTAQRSFSQGMSSPILHRGEDQSIGEGIGNRLGRTDNIERGIAGKVFNTNCSTMRAAQKAESLK